MRMFRFIHGLFLLALVTGSAFARSPYVFTPSGRDDAARLRAALIAYRWVQINGTDIRIDAPINLETDAGVPLHDILLEPAPGIKQTTVHTAISQDPANPTNPSRAPFNYNGGFEPASFLTATVLAGVMSVTIRDPELLVWVAGYDIRESRPFQVGEYICLNDTSSVPDLESEYAEDVQEGSLEVRQILAIDPSGSPGELRLYLEAPLRRPHRARVVVAHCEPLRNAVFRNLRFTTDNRPGARVGIHMHMAFNVEISNVSSVNWRGFSVILLDAGGRNNVVKDCFAAGVNSLGDYPNGWGIAAEGQEGTMILNSGADRHSMGIVINHSVDTFALNSSVQACDIASLTVWPDVDGNPSMHSGFVGGRVYGGGLGVNIGPNCVECVANVSLEYPYSGVKIGLGSYNSRVSGTVLGATWYGVGIDSIDGGPGDGAVSSRGTLLNSSTTCTGTKLVVLKGARVSPRTPSQADWFYTWGPLFDVCP